MMEIEYEIAPPKRLNINVKELLEYKELFYFFTWRDIKVKYKQTFLGFLWAVLQPLLMMLIFSVFLGDYLKDPQSNVPYPVFVYSGLLLWNIFSSGLTSAGNSMVTNSNIIKKIYFPRLIIPISSVLVALFDFFMALIVFVFLLIYYRQPVSVTGTIFIAPLGIIFICITTFGLGSLLAALNIKYRDFRYVIPFMVQAMLFLTPVIYPTSLLTHDWLKYVVAVNPVYCGVELFRNGLLGGAFDLKLILISAFSSITFLVIGLYYFRKTEAYFADVA